MKRRVCSLILGIVMLAVSIAPAYAAATGGTGYTGHEVLTKLPGTLPTPTRPTTLEQAEGRVESRMISAKRAQERWDAAFAELRDRYGYSEAEAREEMKGYDSGILPTEWTLSQSKEGVFREFAALADSLTSGKTTDTEKVKAIFDWAAQNIKYDYTAYQYYVWQDSGYFLTDAQKATLNQAADPFYAYVNKKAICEGYANVCWLMCSMAGIPAVKISGDSNERGLNGGGPHAWNAALVAGKWHFFDATWNMWDMAPNYHKTSEGIAYCDGAFQVSDGQDENSKSYWLCPGFDCPADVVIPEGCWNVMAESFMGCTTLKSVTLPSTCTIIQTSAFEGCTGLERITIPASVESVLWKAFKDCTSLRSVTFGNPGVDVWETAFDNTPMITEAKDFALVGSVLYKYKGSAKEVTIPAGVTSIAENAFPSSFDAPTKVIIPEGCVRIGGGAFSNNRALKEVTIPKSVTSIGDSAFSNTPWLKVQGDWPVFGGILLAYQGPDVESVTVPDGVQELASRAFYYSGSKIRSITFPASLKKIGAWMLNHSYLENVTFKGTREQWDAVDIVLNGDTNWVMRDWEGEETATVTCLGLEDPTLTTTPPSTVPEIVSTGVNPERKGTAYAASQSVEVDGRAVEFQMYALRDANGNPTNYVKLRDVADILDGTNAQFNVTWTAQTGVGIETRSPYSSRNGQENKTPYSGDRDYVKGADTTQVNGVAIPLQAFVLTDDNGGQSTYYKLRDLGQAVGFNVGWSVEKGVYIETDKPYEAP